jgi:hypothetical protein
LGFRRAARGPPACALQGRVHVSVGARRCCGPRIHGRRAGSPCWIAPAVNRAAKPHLCCSPNQDALIVCYKTAPLQDSRARRPSISWLKLPFFPPLHPTPYCISWLKLPFFPFFPPLHHACQPTNLCQPCSSTCASILVKHPRAVRAHAEMRHTRPRGCRPHPPHLSE